MKSNYILILVFVFPLIFLTSCKSKLEQAQKPKHPNIVFIAVDDLRPDLGCYGNSIVKSPHMDKLAASGFLFENQFANVPTCGASRYGLLTGLLPYSRKCLENSAAEALISNQSEKEIPETFIHQLRRQGYHTVGIGKISHSPDGLLYGYNEQPSNKRELTYSWDELLFNPGKWETGWNAFFGYADGNNRQNLQNQVKPYEKGKTDDKGYADGLTTELAVNKLKELQNSKKPFFLGVGLFKPHLPFTAPEKYWDLYNENDISVSLNPNIPDNINENSLHNSNEFNQYQLGDEKPSLEHRVSDAYAKKLRHAYYACVSYADSQIGLIVNEIKRLGLDDNTIIVVWGDHGWHLGDQQVWGKHTLFDNALRSVLIIKVPNKTAKTITSIVQTVDIYPTLMELCNVKMDYNIDGNSFAYLLDGENKANQDGVAYSYFINGISLRTKRYRLTKYFRKEEPVIELYDHETDPMESLNIANKQPKVVERLMPLLEKGDTGLYKKKA